MKILLVDDDAFLRDMYAAKFAEESFDVCVAKNGEEALGVLEEEDDIDVVLLDMIMPGLSGLDLLKEVKLAKLKKEPQCIVLSNQSEQKDKDEALSAGAVGYIVKAERIPSEVVDEVKKIAQ